MKTWNVSGSVHAGTYVGEFEAETGVMCSDFDDRITTALEASGIDSGNVKGVG